METEPDVFILNPRYADFVPGKSPVYVESLTGLTCGSTVFMILLALFCTSPLLFGFFNIELSQARFRDNGIQTKLRIVTCNTVRNASQNVSYSSLVTVEYLAGETLLSAATKLSGRCENYPIDSTVTGVYLKDDPASIEPVFLEELDRPYFARQPQLLIGVLIAMPVMVGIVFLLIQYFVGNEKAHQLQTRGRLLDGRVVSAKWDIYAIIEYEFDTPDGKHRTGTQKAARKDLQPPKIGDKEKRKPKDITPLPEAGTPVRVLYVDDNTHMML